MARHILDNPEVVAGRRVLDLGAGGGLVAISAALAGASRAYAADIDPYALIATRLNAAANAVELETVLGDLTTGGVPDADLILVGDLFYEQDLATRVTAYLERCRGAGIAVLIGDPWRVFLPAGRLVLLAEYPVTDFGDPEGAVRRAGVFTLAA